MSMRIITTVLIAIVCATTASRSQSPGVPASPSGRLIDLGGWRVHLNCIGETNARPTVILEAGAGGFSVDWSLVQPAVARFARVCSYDRGGLGWSDLGPSPRTLRQVVSELHSLLEKAGERPPFVMVGHSYGGILVRQYALTYPSDVVGMVFDESGHERGVQVFRNGRMVRLVESATGATIPEAKASGPLRVADIPAETLQQIERAAHALAPRANDPPRDKLPPEAQKMRAWSFAQVKHWASNDNPFEGEELAALLTRWTGTKYVFGDLPLIVLSRGRADADPAQEEEHRANQAELLTLSRAAKQVIAQKSGHLILVDEPALVVSAIREVVELHRR
jgi:pimeloyl-ACP methyl ester carboxylesterase